MTIGRLTAILFAGAALAACGGGRNDHPADGDTGQAAPATVPTVNNPEAPDSTTGVSPALSGTPQGNNPGIAGDTTSSQQPGGAKPPQPVGDPRRP